MLHIRYGVRAGSLSGLRARAGNHMPGVALFLFMGPPTIEEGNHPTKRTVDRTRFQLLAVGRRCGVSHSLPLACGKQNAPIDSA